ncbi:cholesterol 7-desaturase [Drosophila busckii]|uniref:cholesterol 7-desaturase n=1 Tax=Drosophila busckii TaxID=30019 RepID=UPI00083E97D5|nr:cholesterol 7-desaturase [Drosophila busckii]
MEFLIKSVINIRWLFDTILRLVQSNYLIILIVIGIISVCLYWLFFVPLNWNKHVDDWLCQKGDNGYRGKYKCATINRLRKARKVGAKELPPPYPNGWYGILESSSIKPGESTFVSCLGEQFVVFRSEEGTAFILDAYCPHLGANLGIGGRINGDTIICPFHQWSFQGTDGLCTNIPYSKNIPPATRIRKWISTEQNGFVFLWYNAESSELPWTLPISPEVENNGFVYQGRNEFLVNCHIQEIPENGADLAHFKAIHNESIIAGGYNPKNSIFRWLGQHSWHASWDYTREKHIAEIRLKHSLKFYQKINLFEIDVVGKQIGPAFVHLTLKSSIFGECQIFQTVTPIEPLVQKVVHRFYATRKMSPILKILIYGESVMFERDMNMWNQKLYRKSPILVPEDASIKKFRKWYAQFYTENSKVFGLRDNNDW